jgi:D-alanyl-lipoteichoic acid acyltransferase DltB (MBOAT superfamily)
MVASVYILSLIASILSIIKGGENNLKKKRQWSMMFTAMLYIIYTYYISKFMPNKRITPKVHISQNSYKKD